MAQNNDAFTSVDLQREIFFYGYTPAPKGSTTAISDPTQFIQEIDDRKTRGSWSEQKTVNYIVCCLREEARDWFRTSAAIHLTNAELAVFHSNYTAGFRPLFCHHYHVTDVDTRPQLASFCSFNQFSFRNKQRHS